MSRARPLLGMVLLLAASVARADETLVYFDCWSTGGSCGGGWPSNCFPSAGSTAGFDQFGNACDIPPNCQDGQLGVAWSTSDPAGCPPILGQQNGCGFMDPLPAGRRVFDVWIHVRAWAGPDLNGRIESVHGNRMWLNGVESDRWGFRRHFACTDSCEAAAPYWNDALYNYGSWNCFNIHDEDPPPDPQYISYAVAHLMHGPDLTDTDGDTVVDTMDNCPTRPNPGQEDTDGDEVGNACDNCPTAPNADQADRDGDRIGDACDLCPDSYNRRGTPNRDSDGDTLGDGCDNCPNAPNADQADSDDDGWGDACDNCPDAANILQEDADADGVGDLCDNCPLIGNPDQSDRDDDGIGDACEPDRDADGIGDSFDNCPTIYNPSQADADFDGTGDACDFTLLAHRVDFDYVVSETDGYAVRDNWGAPLVTNIDFDAGLTRGTAAYRAGASGSRRLSRDFPRRGGLSNGTRSLRASFRTNEPQFMATQFDGRWQSGTVWIRARVLESGTPIRVLGPIAAQIDRGVVAATIVGFAPTTSVGNDLGADFDGDTVGDVGTVIQWQHRFTEPTGGLGDEANWRFADTPTPDVHWYWVASTPLPPQAEPWIGVLRHGTKWAEGATSTLAVPAGVGRGMWDEAQPNGWEYARGNLYSPAPQFPRYSTGNVDVGTFALSALLLDLPRLRTLPRDRRGVMCDDLAMMEIVFSNALGCALRMRLLDCTDDPPQGGGDHVKVNNTAQLGTGICGIDGFDVDSSVPPDGVEDDSDGDTLPQDDGYSYHKFSADPGGRAQDAMLRGDSDGDPYPPSACVPTTQFFVTLESFYLNQVFAPNVPGPHFRGGCLDRTPRDRAWDVLQ